MTIALDRGEQALDAPSGQVDEVREEYSFGSGARERVVGCVMSHDSVGRCRGGTCMTADDRLGCLRRRPMDDGSVGFSSADVHLADVGGVMMHWGESCHHLACVRCPPMGELHGALYLVGLVRSMEMYDRYLLLAADMGLHVHTLVGT